MRIAIWLVAAAILSGGCSKRTEETTSSKPVAETTPQPVTIPESASEMPALPAGEVVVEVGPHQLTWGQMQDEMQWRIGQAGASAALLSQDAGMRQRLQSEVSDQFVVHSLLLDEADRASIAIATQEVETAMEELKGRIPTNTTWQTFLAEQGIAETTLQQRVVNDLRIDRLIKSRVPTNEVTDKQLAEFREARADSLAVPERVQARHILLAAEKDADPAVRAEKKAQAEKLRDRLEKGADFAALAKAESDCPSKAKGGDLGVFPRGQMVPPFDAAAFSQATNVIGPVVETDFGYHIIQVLKHEAAGTVSDDEIREYLKSMGSRDAVRDLIDKLRSAADVKVKHPELLSADR